MVKKIIVSQHLENSLCESLYRAHHIVTFSHNMYATRVSAIIRKLKSSQTGSIPGTWFTLYSEDIVYTFKTNGLAMGSTRPLSS